jgi:exonuclease SbcC
MKYYINRLYLKNFKCVGREDGLMVELGIEQGLENGVIALSGPNGFGKTTIFDAIQIAFCDEIDRINEINPKNKKIKDNIYIYGNKDYAIIALELVNINNNDKITIIKKIERMNDNNEKNRKNCINSFWTNEEININKLDNNDYGEKIDDLGKFLENNIGLKKDYYTSFFQFS